MISSGYRIAIFTENIFRRLLKTDLILAVPNEKCVIKATIEVGGIHNSDCEVGEQKVIEARIAITREPEKSLICQYCSTKFRLAEAELEDENENFVNYNVRQSKLSPEHKRIQHKFPNLFKRLGRILCHNNRTEFKWR